MSTIEFQTELHGEPTLRLPPEVLARLPKSGRATVVVMVQGESAEWRKGAYEQFTRDDEPADDDASGRRVALPLVPSSRPGSRPLTAQQVAELFEEDDLSL